CWGSSATSGEGSKRHEFRTGEKTKYGCGPTLGSTQLVVRNRFCVPILVPPARVSLVKLAGKVLPEVVSLRASMFQPSFAKSLSLPYSAFCFLWSKAIVALKRSLARSPQPSRALAPQPRPRREALETPPVVAPDAVATALLLLPCSATPRPCRNCSTLAEPVASISCRVTICTGSAVSASTRLMLEPVISTRSMVCCPNTAGAISAVTHAAPSAIDCVDAMRRGTVFL